MKINKMNVGKAEDFVNRMIVVLEGINMMQSEKDSVIESYYRIKKEYSEGKIGFEVFKESINRLNNELGIIDENIKEQIRISNLAVDSIKKHVNFQKPVKLDLKPVKL